MGVGSTTPLAPTPHPCSNSTKDISSSLGNNLKSVCIKGFVGQFIRYV